MTALRTGIDERAWSARSYPGTDTFQLCALAYASASAARTIDETLLKPACSGSARAALESRPLLAWLTFCYAREIYGSIEVAARLHRGEYFFRVGGKTKPDAATIRRFRCENRDALESCL